MGFRINTNIGAMNAHRNATMNNVELDKSLTSLSSGLRINKAADDSAGLAIANKLSVQSQGLGQAIRNANDMIGLVQTADGAWEEVGNIFQRIRTLSIQSANDTQDADSRSYIQKEVNALAEQYFDILTSTKFNGINLFNTVGVNPSTDFVAHTGAYANDTMTINIRGGSPFGFNVSTQAASEANITLIDTFLKNTNENRATLGAAQNKLESIVRNISVTQVNVSAAESNIRDVDFAGESANFAKHNILAQSGSYAMSQANAVQQNVLKLLQ